MTLLSSLFGCKTVRPEGPNFSQTISKVLHVKPLVQVKYEMPGNMSSTFGFSEKYKNETKATNVVDLSKENTFRPFNWRKSIDVDGAKWDYSNTKKKNSENDLASLNIQIDIAEYQTKENFEDSINALFDAYLNGASGLNTEVRKSDFANGRPDDELGRWILSLPGTLEATPFGDNAYYTWNFDDEARGNFSKNYAIPLDNKHFLLFEFRYAISAESDKEFALVQELIFEDAAKFMALVSITE